MFYVLFDVVDVDVNRILVFDMIIFVFGDVLNCVEGFFGINNIMFYMDLINIIVFLNFIEIWILKNNMFIVYLFYIYDI